MLLRLEVKNSEQEMVQATMQREYGSVEVGVGVKMGGSRRKTSLTL